MKRIACLLLATVSFFTCPSHAQTPPSETSANTVEDEIVAYGTKRLDPAMSAFLAGDYVTAEVEFKRNAFCALRATRNFRSGVEDARDASVRAEVGGGTLSGQPNDSSGTASSATAAASPSINSMDLNQRTTNKRSCNDRGYQLYMAGLSQIKLGKMDDAKDSFKRAVVHRKSIHDAYFRLALLEYQDGNLDKVRKQFKRLRKLDKNCRDCEFEAEIEQQVAYLDNLLTTAN